MAGAEPQEATLVAPGAETIDQEIAGLENLETPAPRQRSRVVAAAAKAWPPLAAAGIALVLWQAVVLTGWRPDYLLPGPASVLRRLAQDLSGGTLLKGVAITVARAAVGFAIALLVGTLLGLALARVKFLRAAMGSLISGLQTMPSIAWFPLAILLFQLTEAAILFVVILGAAPAITNGLLSGIDHIPPVLLRAGRVMGAKGLSALRHVVLPAALPGYVAGVKQGWAFAWRSLMAGELLVIIPGRSSIGAQLTFAREAIDAQGVVVMMLVILVMGIAVDALVFGRLERSLRRRRGLLDPTTGGAVR